MRNTQAEDMVQYFDFEIMGLKRKLPFVKVGDHLALASFVVLSDTELIQTVAPELMKRLPEVDVLMTAEAKGICLTYELSRLMGMKDFVVARKSRKPYMQNAVSHSVRSVTTQKEQMETATVDISRCSMELHCKSISPGSVARCA